MSKVLATPLLRQHFDDWAEKADALVESLVAPGEFDGAELAACYGHMIVPAEIGLTNHRPDLLGVYGLVGANGKYPFNDLYKATSADPRLAEAVRWVDESCERDRLAPGGWGAAVHAAADEGRCTHETAKLLVRSLVSAGVENTVLAIGNMVHAFATHPDQWARLRADPDLVRNAIEEVMRWAGPTYQFFRTTSADTTIGDFTIPAGSKVLLFLGVANRDPRWFENPDRFDISRNTAAHFGFGFGPHQCIGQVIARQEMTVVLQALVRRVESLRLRGEPVLRLTNTARGFESLPVEVTLAA